MIITLKCGDKRLIQLLITVSTSQRATRIRSENPSKDSSTRNRKNKVFNGLQSF